MKQNAEKLDEMMVLMFEFINMTCGMRQPLDLPNGGSISSPATPAGAAAHSPALPTSPGDQSPSEVLFEALVAAFRASVMQTYKCRSCAALSPFTPLLLPLSPAIALASFATSTAMGVAAASQPATDHPT